MFRRRLTDPLKVIRTGPNEDISGDPTLILQKELSVHRYVKIPEIPTFTGGAIGYVAYDCVQHFEPKTARQTWVWIDISAGRKRISLFGALVCASFLQVISSSTRVPMRYPSTLSLVHPAVSVQAYYKHKI